MSERLAFVRSCLDRRETIKSICDRFGISRKTGYKILKRFTEEGPDGLENRSRARLTHPYRVTPEVIARIVALKREHPKYGPRILHDWLVQHWPEEHWPAPSTIGELLRQRGLVQKKRRHLSDEQRAALEKSRTRASDPNMVWTADFKGQFRLRCGAGEYCYPLTALDLHTHFCLGCIALRTTAIEPTMQCFVRLFREYGLPRVIRTDNGIPFAQPNALGRLGRLAFWWVRLGIRPEHIALGRPSENGAHERFHRTLKAHTSRPSASSMRAQQRRFDDFKSEYNMDRPHSSLPKRLPPGAHYTPSPRPYPEKLPVLLYPESFAARRVDPAGSIKWRNHAIFLSGNISGQYVGIDEAADGLFTISYGDLALGDFDAATSTFIPRVRWRG